LVTHGPESLSHEGRWCQGMEAHGHTPDCQSKRRRLLERFLANLAKLMR
jgi:hypothetical protein